MSQTNRRRMKRRVARSAKRGQAPGSAVYTGQVVETPIDVKVIDFDEEGVRRFETLDGEVQGLAAGADTVTWVDFHGLHDVDQVNALATAFDLHPLWVEDLLNPACRPKSEVIDDKILVIVKMAKVVHEVGSGEIPEIDTEHVGLVSGPGFVLSFQERLGDVWDPVRTRIETGTRIRKMGASYLLHALLDGVVDEYFVVLEQLEHAIDELEERTLSSRNVDLPPALYTLRGEITGFRAVVWPAREAIGQLVRGDWDGISAVDTPFYRDLYDHLVQAMDITDASRERLVSVVELQLAITSHQMNLVMRLLTVVSTIFIPLTFIAGIYGMNFVWMPELQTWWAYPLVWAVMLTTGAGLLLGFRRRGWL